MQLSEHFTLEEMTASETASRRGIDNTPPQSVIDALKVACAGMERVRSILGQPIHVNSGYRSPKLNVAIGGSKTSAHVTGYAVDFICPGFGDPLTVARAIKNHGIHFDQLIFEHTWVHISFAPRMRGEVLTLVGKGYVSGIVP